MFPKEAGLFLALKKDRAVMVRITGFFPFLKVRDSYDLGNYIATGELKTISSGDWYSIQQDLDKEWQFSPSLTESDSPSTTRCVSDGKVELTEEEKKWAFETYTECTKAGCSITSILQMTRSKFNLSTAQAKLLLNEISNIYSNK